MTSMVCITQPRPQNGFVLRFVLHLPILPSEQNDFKPPFRSFCLRRKGRARGVRLIDRADVLRYIRQHVEPTYDETELCKKH